MAVKRRILTASYLEVKTESDINREIRSWVLNKGVGESVLHKAARLGYIDVVAYCLERMHMDPDQKDNAGYTPLHEACSKGQIGIAKILLYYGANYSETALSGIRPLHEAIDNGHLEIVRLLLSYGADPQLATYSGEQWKWIWMVLISVMHFDTIVLESNICFMFGQPVPLNICLKLEFIDICMLNVGCANSK